MVPLRRDEQVMGRPRKAPVNSVVVLPTPKYGVVVDYRTDVKWGRYLVVESDALGRNPKGAAVWLDSTEFEPVGRVSRKPGRIYRKNISPLERGCACQCCEHSDGYAEPE